MAAYARTPSALMWLHANGLINGLYNRLVVKPVYMPIVYNLRYMHMYHLAVTKTRTWTGLGLDWR